MATTDTATRSSLETAIAKAWEQHITHVLAGRDDSARWWQAEADKLLDQLSALRRQEQ